ncbi:MAG: hypothetical protein D6820_11125, partial [Lentisphaerae bacterium]
MDEYDFYLKLPEDAEGDEALLVKGYAMLDAHNPEMAFQMLKKYEERVADDYRCDLGLGFAYMFMHQEIEAIKYFNRGLRKKPEFLGAYRDRAFCFCMIGEYERALKDIEFIFSQIDLERLNVEDDAVFKAIVLKAQILLELERYEEGLAMFDAAFLSKFKTPEKKAAAYRIVSEFLLKYGNVFLGLEFAADAVKIEPENMENWLFLMGAMEYYSYLLIMGFDLDQMSFIWEKLVEEFPNQPGALYIQARAAMENGCFKRALPLAEKLIHVNPEDHIAILTYGETLHALKELDKARECFLKGLKISPGEKSYLCHLAEISLEKEDPKQAEEYLVQAARHNDFSAEELQRWIKTLVRFGHFEPICNMLEALLERLPTNPTYLVNLADIYHCMGKIDEANQIYETLCSNTPTENEDLRAHIRALEALDRHHEAINAYQRLKKIDETSEETCDFGIAMNQYALNKPTKCRPILRHLISVVSCKSPIYPRAHLLYYFLTRQRTAIRMVAVDALRKLRDALYMHPRHNERCGDIFEERAARFYDNLINYDDDSDDLDSDIFDEVEEIEEDDEIEDIDEIEEDDE